MFYYLSVKKKTTVTIPESQLPVYLKKVRGDRTQAEFGAFLGITKQAVTQYEAGDIKPSQKVLDKLGIEKMYDVPIL